MAKTPSGNIGRLRSRTTGQRLEPARRACFVPRSILDHADLDVALADKARRKARSGNSLVTFPLPTELPLHVLPRRGVACSAASVASACVFVCVSAATVPP
jgi:hypothetical protein